MPLCPKCHTPLDEDYGVITCSQCQAVMMIDLEGNIILHDEEVSTQDVAVESSQDMPHLQDLTMDPAQDLPPEPNHELQTEQETPMALAFSAESETTEAVLDTAPTNDESNADFLTFNEEQSQADQPGPEGDPFGVIEYANRPDSHASEGTLLYVITVYGISTQDLQEELRKVLEEPRFGFAAEELLSQIENGSLSLPKVGAAKASVIVKRLLAKGFTVDWTQELLQKS